MRRLFGQVLASAPNLAGLAGVQLANALVPIIVFPLALHSLGVADYAALVTAEAVSVMVTTAVLYSFEIEGVARSVDLRLKQDRAALAKLSAAIMWTRMLIWLGTAAVAMAGAWLTGFAAPDVLAGWLLVSLGNAFFGNCIYQAHERTFRLGLITLAVRLASVALVFLLPIRALGPAAVSFALGGSFLAGGLVAMVNMRRELGIAAVRPRVNDMRDLMRSGWQIFLGNVSVILYRDVNVLVLGVLGTSATAIAAYSLAEKFVKLVQAVIRPFTQLMFPRAVAAIRDKGRPDRTTRVILARTVRIQWLLLAAMMAGLAVAIAIILPYWPEVAQLAGFARADVLIMLPATFLGVASFMFGSIGLNTLGDRTAYLIALVITGVASVSGLALLTALHVAHAAAIAFLGAEALLLALVLLRFRRAAEIGS